MTSRTPGRTAGIEKVVERQMRNWELTHAQKFQDAKKPSPVHNFVTISRQLGSGGSDVAHLLGAKLGWPVFDKEILQTMALGEAKREKVYQKVDERMSGWLEDTLKGILREQEPHDYFRRLTKTVTAIVRHGPAVFVGRGTDMILPRDGGLRVEITASAELCINRLMDREDISREEAASRIDQVHRERSDYLRTYFRGACDDPLRFDLNINMDRYGIEEAAELIEFALNQRGISVSE